MKRIGGWLRLWIVSLILWGVWSYFYAFVMNSGPSIKLQKEDFSNHSAVLEVVSDQYELSEREKRLLRGEYGFIPELVSVGNGQKLLVKPRLEQNQLQKILDHSQQHLKRKRLAQVQDDFLVFMAVWLLPGIAVLMLGVTIKWVYRGFTNSPNI